MKNETTTTEIMEFLEEHMVTKEDHQKDLAKLKYDLLSAIDDKFADYTSDIFKRLDKKYQTEKQFKTKVIDLFRKHKIGTLEEIAYLEGLAGQE